MRFSIIKSFFIYLAFAILSPILATKAMAGDLMIEGDLASQLPPSSCPADRLFYFHLQPLKTAPSRTTIHFHADDNGLGMITQPDLTTDLRLEVCMTDKELVLDRFIYRESSGMYYVGTQKPSVKIKGLDEATQGNPASLNIQFPYSFTGDMETTTAFLMTGAQDGNQSFVAFTFAFRDEKGNYQPFDSNVVLVGTLEMGDPFANVKCVTGLYQQTHLQTGSLVMDVESCVFGGTSGTRGYDIISLTLTDINPAVAESFRGKPTSLKGNDLTTQLKVQMNHHNNCDTFLLKMPFANYSGLVAPVAGDCTVSDPLFPHRDPQSTRGDLLIKAVYPDHSTWQDFVVGLRHFAFPIEDQPGL